MKPLTLLIKPAAGLCNINCQYCFYKAASGKRKNSLMNKTTVDVLVQRIKEYEPSSLSLMFQGGEPTLAGLDFFQYFANAVKKNVSCPVTFALQTNGLLIDAEYAKFFKENNFLIGVSLDGSKRTNDRYRLDESGNSTLSSVLASISILKKYKVDFNILSVIDDENAKDIDITWAYFKRHGFDFLQFIPYVDEGNGVSLSCENYERFLKRSFDLWYEDYINGKYISVRHIDNYINILLGNQPESCAMSGICGNYFVIEANGDIYPCDFYCKSEYKLGTIFDDKPFATDTKRTAFIAQSQLIHMYCKGCKYHILCRGGCRRDREDNNAKNKYCNAYYNFFDYAAERMAIIARSIKNE